MSQPVCHSPECYLDSKLNRAVDVVVGTAARPAATLARLVAQRAFIPASVEPIFRQYRTAAGGELALIDKIKTCDDETGLPYEHALAELYRKLGLDEVAQANQLYEGTMSVFGARPLIKEEEDALYEEVRRTMPRREDAERLLDLNARYVLPHKRAVISTHAIEAHTGRNISPVETVALNVRDAMLASPAHHARLALLAVEKLAKNELQHGQVQRPSFNQGL